MSHWRPTAEQRALQFRADTLARIRSFFATRGVMEVETPTLSSAGNSDPNLSQWRTTNDFWLRTSPEYAMKRLLAAGSGDIYELGRAFRAGESGRMHNPEFTLLEWYRVGWSYRDLAQEVCTLVAHCGDVPGKRWNTHTTTYRSLLLEVVGIDPLRATTQELQAATLAAGISLPESTHLDRDDWLDLLMSHCAQPALPENQLTVVMDYPASQAALARIRPGTPPVAERFEVFLGSIELANGYQELSDAAEQHRRFEEERRRRERLGLPVPPMDERLLAALRHGLPECAGVALGVDRLLAVLLGASHLDEVLAIPHARA